VWISQESAENREDFRAVKSAIFTDQILDSCPVLSGVIYSNMKAREEMKDNTYLSRDELCDLAHGIKMGFLRWDDEAVLSDEVLRVIASLRNEIGGPNNGLILKAAKIISKHIREIQCIQDAANFPPDIPKGA
jgi:hypothetical protein